MTISHISLPNTTGAVLVAQLISETIKAQQMATRCKSLLDAYTGGGVTPANIETDPFWNVGAGNGATVYNMVVSVMSSINAISGLNNLDQGS